MNKSVSAALALGLTALLAAAAGAQPQPSPQPSGQQMVDALHAAFGDHHARAVHAKGLMVEGVFEPAATAATLTDASLFKGHAIPVLARFSDFTGIPEIPDTIPESNPRGLALKFRLPGGGTADVVAHSFNGFPTATSAEFRELLLALSASGPGVPKPTPLDRFLGAHPVAVTFLTTQKPASVSYATLSYFGVNAFAFSKGKDAPRFVRYRFAPQGGEAFLTPEALAGQGPNYLQDELPRRLARGPVVFDWFAQVAAAGDAIDNPSVAWPEGRQLVKLGTIRLQRMAPEPQTSDRATIFVPTNVPKGIEPADPMLGVRKAAYGVSFQHRQ